MSARFEVVHTGPYKFHARFVAANNEPVWVTESYKTRRAAYKAVWGLAAHFRDNGSPWIREVVERTSL